MTYEQKTEKQRILESLPLQAATAYNTLIEKHPKLSSVELKTHTGESAARYHHGIAGTDNPPHVTLNSDWRTIAREGLMRVELQPLRDVIIRNLGVSNLTPELLYTFIMLHEFGHAYNYFQLPLDRQREVKSNSISTLMRTFNARNLPDFIRRNPNSSNAERYSFTKAYREIPTEKVADSLACELMQKVAREKPLQFPEVTRLEKNY